MSSQPVSEPTIETNVTQMETATWTEFIQPSMLYRLARFFGENPDLISLAGGAPDPNLCPRDELAAAATHTMSTNPRSLQYGRDLPALKEQIVGLMALRGVTCTPDQITITGSGQHAMDVLSRLFLNPGGQVMLEELVYSGIQQAVAPFQPEILTIPIDSVTGLDLDRLEGYLEAGARPAFFYTIAEAHNPLALSLSPQKRERLIQIARRYQVPIIEDDAYGFLNYEAQERPPLCALDDEWVIYIGSFAKIIAPGLRLGWIVSPTALVPKIQVTKQLALLCVAVLSQHIVTTYLSMNDFAAHLRHLRQEYGRRRDAMLDAMAQHFPPEVTWNKPSGGLFIWVKLPEGFDTEEILYRAAKEIEVGFIPGKAFVTDQVAAQGRYDNYMRLTFARYEAERLQEGIARLGRLLKQIIRGD